MAHVTWEGSPMDQHEPATHVLHTNCPEGKVCPALIAMSSRPHETVVVGRLVTDPAEAAALGRHIGPGEGALIVPDDLIREANL